MNEELWSDPNPEMLSQVRKRISERDNTTNITFFYEFFALNGIGLEEVNFTSQVTIQFDLSKYTVLTGEGRIFLRKYYFDSFSESEIKDITMHEAQRHKDFIETSLQDSESKQDQSN